LVLEILGLGLMLWCGTERVLFHYGNHPVKWVRVTGVIVAVDEYAGRNVYTVDDSSGMCIECVCVAPTPPPKTETMVPAHLNQIALLNQAANAETKKDVGNGDTDRGKEKTAPSVQDPNVPWEEMDVGVVVKVKGRVGDFWKQKQVEVVKVEVLRSTDVEVRCWNEVMDFKRDVLGKAWVVSTEEEERCRRVRERELRHARNGKRGKEKERASNKEESNGNGEREEARRKRKGLEKKEVDAKRRKEKDEALKAKNKVNYPSLAVRRAAAGKYDALGI
jgi:hypothetical protein